MGNWRDAHGGHLFKLNGLSLMIGRESVHTWLTWAWGCPTKLGLELCTRDLL